VDIIDYRVVPIAHKLPVSDLIVFITVLVVTVVEDLLVAMGIGMALACFRFVQEITKVYKYELDKDSNTEELSERDGNVTFSPKGPLFFGSVQKINNVLSGVSNQKSILIDLSNVVFIDLSGAFALDDAVKNFRERGVVVEIYSPKGEVNKVLENLNLYKKWQEECEAKLQLAV